MKNKKKTRFFWLQCCNTWIELPEEDFTYDGMMDLYCHKHKQTIVDYLYWRAGFEEEAMKEIKDKEKEKSKNETSSCKSI
jgi:hypothetical protein